MSLSLSLLSRSLAFSAVQLLVGAVVTPAFAAPAEPSCIYGYGAPVCGYSCIAADGKARCAQTPEGVCGAAYGQLKCWDPSPEVRAWMSYTRSAELPACRADSGQLACGFDCISAYGKVRCAQTPAGICQSGLGQVRCWDPEREVLWSMAYRGEIAEPECHVEYNQLVCGYHCTAQNGRARCAQNPEGFCQDYEGQIRCWDPPTTESGAVRAALPMPPSAPTRR